MTTPTPTKLQTALQTLLTERAAAAGGFSASDVTGYSPEQVRRAAESLVREGRIIRHAVSPRRIRYFADAPSATQFSVHVNQVATAKRMAVGARTRAPWSADEPGLITAQTKITVAPPLPGRVFRTNTYPMY